MNNLRILFIAIIAMLTFSPMVTAQQTEDDIVGIWDAGERKVEIRKVEDRYIGSPIDTLGVRRDEVEVLNLQYNKGKWKGKLYSVKKDKWMSVECTIKEEELELRVKAGIMKKTLNWARVE